MPADRSAPAVARLALLLGALAVATSGCVTYDLASAPTKDLGVGHVSERLPITVKVARFRDRSTGEEPLGSRVLARCTDSFATSLRRTDLFDQVTTGNGDFADLGFEGDVLRLRCTQDYACVWCFYSAFALIAVPANLPLSVDDAVYDLRVRVSVPRTGQLLATYTAQVHLHSWRGAWSLFSTFLEDPGQVFDRANQAILNQVVDDYAKYRSVAIVPPPAPSGWDAPGGEPK